MGNETWTLRIIYMKTILYTKFLVVESQSISWKELVCLFASAVSAQRLRRHAATYNKAQLSMFYFFCRTTQVKSKGVS